MGEWTRDYMMVLTGWLVRRWWWVSISRALQRTVVVMTLVLEGASVSYPVDYPKSTLSPSWNHSPSTSELTRGNMPYRTEA